MAIFRLIFCGLLAWHNKQRQVLHIARMTLGGNVATRESRIASTARALEPSDADHLCERQWLNNPLALVACVVGQRSPPGIAAALELNYMK